MNIYRKILSVVLFLCSTSLYAQTEFYKHLGEVKTEKGEIYCFSSSVKNENGVLFTVTLSKVDLLKGATSFPASSLARIGIIRVPIPEETPPSYFYVVKEYSSGKDADLSKLKDIATDSVIKKACGLNDFSRKK
jgi:hypothetical protein